MEKATAHIEGRIALGVGHYCGREDGEPSAIESSSNSTKKYLVVQMLSCLGYCHTVLATVGWRASWVKVRASIVAGEERAESPVAEREKERECRTGVSQNAGRKRANCDAIGCMRCRAPFISPCGCMCWSAAPDAATSHGGVLFPGEPAESLPCSYAQHAGWSGCSCSTTVYICGTAVPRC